MEFIRKYKKISIVVLVFLVIFLVVGVTYGRYIYNIIDNYILETKAFYFNSGVLGINGKGYAITNWDGVSTYPINVDVNNQKSEDVYTNVDIDYDIHVDCPTTVRCTLSKTSSTIHVDDHTDSYQINVTPLTTFREGNFVTVYTYVESTSPYKKTLSATYNLGIQISDFSYDIEDSVGSKYLTLNLTNAITFYKASTDFGTYHEGDTISIDTYSTLTAAEQANCYSAIVTLTFNPRYVLADLTSDLYLDRLSTNYLTEQVNGFDYVSKFSFKIGASSSKKIKFYKPNVQLNYKYPGVASTPIVNVSVITVND